MASIAARLFNGYLRLAVKRKPLHLIDAPELRRFFDSRSLLPLAKGVAVERIDAASAAGEWHRPAAAPASPRPTILYLHGGGYVFGSVAMYRTLTYRLALAADADVFSAEYRLAPEHPCPAAIEDAVRAYHWLLAGGVRPSRIVVAGDSAGGGLALATLQDLRARGAPLPAGAVLYSPWTDLSCSGASIAANAASDATFNETSIREGGSRYRGALGPDDPRVSPLFGDFAGLPPLLIFASRAEMLYDDSARLVARARAEGVETEFVPRDGLAHVWPLYASVLPEGREAIAKSAEFVRARTKT